MASSLTDAVSVNFPLQFSPHTLAKSPKDLGVYWIKVLDLFKDVDESSSMFGQKLALRYYHRMLNDSAQNEHGVSVNFRRRATNRLP